MKREQRNTTRDIGWGTEIKTTHRAETNGENGWVVNVDLSEEMISEAIKKTQDKHNILYRNLDIEHNHLDSKFDRIVMLNVYPHLHHPLETVKYLVENNLDNDGLLLIAHSMSREDINNIHSKITDNISYSNLPSAESLAVEFEKIGLTVVSYEDSDDIFCITITK